MMTLSSLSASTATCAGHDKYVVLGEHTLCYRIPQTPSVLGVLSGSVVRGGYSPLNGPVSTMPGDELRPATLEDFDFFRVCPVGHLT